MCSPCKTWLVILPLLFTGGCGIPRLPESQLERALPLPARYDATPYPTPELVSSLPNVFGGSELRGLEQRALRNNPDLLQAGASLDEAGFNLKQTRGALFPTLTASAFRSQSRSVGLFSGSVGLWGASLDAAWELDVWGRIKNNVAASGSDQAAAAADLESAKQSLVAQVIQAYFNVVATNQLLDLAQREKASFEETVALTERRFEAGTLRLSDLELARTDALNASADIESRIDDRDAAARALKILLGDYPDTELARADQWPGLRRSVPSGVPSSLLRRRPDIDAAYQRVRAADSRVKVAHAEMFPSFSLTGGAGRTSMELIDLTKSSANTWNVGANVLAPVFNAGALKAQLGAANAQAVQAFENYRSIALVAFREVEDALSSETRLRREQVERENALEAAKRSESRGRRDFEVGVSDLLTLLESQRRVFDTEEQVITVKANRYNNRVSLALALGKGY